MEAQMKIEIYARENDSSCPLCHAALFGAEAARCGGCDTHYHADCLVELGGCSTLGCAHFRKPLRRDRRLGITLTPVFRPLTLKTRLLASFCMSLGALSMLGNVIGALFGSNAIAVGLTSVVLWLSAFLFLTVWSHRRSRRGTDPAAEPADLAVDPPLVVLAAEEDPDVADETPSEAGVREGKGAVKS